MVAAKVKLGRPCAKTAAGAWQSETFAKSAYPTAGADMKSATTRACSQKVNFAKVSGCLNASGGKINIGQNANRNTQTKENQ